MYLAAFIPSYVVYSKCIWQHTFHHTWFIQNVFSSEHSVGGGRDKSVPYASRSARGRYCTTQVNSAEMDTDAFIDAHSTRRIYPKCIWQHTFHHTWLMRNVFSSIHSTIRGLCEMCLAANIK